MKYEIECQATKSDAFHGDKLSRVDFLNVCGAVVAACGALDVVKKSVFYGREYPHQLGNTIQANASGVVLNWVNGAGEPIPPSDAIDFVHAILGIATEAGELLELLVATAKSKTFDEINFSEELGDVFWYQAIGVKAAGIDFDGVQRQNLAKLKKRFGDKFTAFYANNRDLDAERETLQTNTAYVEVKP